MDAIYVVYAAYAVSLSKTPLPPDGRSRGGSGVLRFRRPLAARLMGWVVVEGGAANGDV